MDRSLAAVGVAKQADKATLATNPTYWHGVSSGKMASVEVTDETSDVTTGLGAPSLAYRTQADLPTGFSTLTFTKAVGLYLLGILGDVTTTGTAPTYTHAFTMDDDVPWLGFFSKLDAWLQHNGQSKIAELSFEWDGPKPLRISVVANGCSFALPAEITVPAADETSGNFFTPVGGVFQADVDGASLAAMSVLAGKITLRRKQTVDFFAGAITPGNIETGSLEVIVDKLDVRPATFADYRTIVTGTVDGTTVSPNVVYGSYSCKFMQGTTHHLTLASSRVKFTAPAEEAGRDAGPVTLQLSGEGYVSDSITTPITATLVNDVVSY